MFARTSRERQWPRTADGKGGDALDVGVHVEDDRAAGGQGLVQGRSQVGLPILVLPPRGPAVCPWLTSVIDDGTRALVGWAIALTPHTGTALTALRMALAVDGPRGPFGAERLD